MTDERSGSQNVAVTAVAMRSILQEARTSEDGLETGGILLGHDAGRLDVRHAGGPGPGAVREPTRFLRDLHHAREHAQRAWEDDGSQWIGEWHTHPTGDLVPSATDLRSYLAHLEDPELGLQRFLAIIVSSRDSEVRAAAWIVYATTAYLVAIEEIEED